MKTNLLMNIQQIKAAIADGKTVYWKSHLYHVVIGFESQLYIHCQSTGHRIGMESDGGQMINSAPNDFYTK